MSLTQIARNCARVAVRANGIRAITAQPQMRLLHRLVAPAMCNGVTQVSIDAGRIILKVQTQEYSPKDFITSLSARKSDENALLLKVNVGKIALSD